MEFLKDVELPALSRVVKWLIMVRGVVDAVSLYVDHGQKGLHLYREALIVFR